VTIPCNAAVVDWARAVLGVNSSSSKEPVKARTKLLIKSSIFLDTSRVSRIAEPLG
jgi:hypothetical protein